jgi:hypothetical protein
MTRHIGFRRADLARALAVAKESGLTVSSGLLRKSGEIEIQAAPPAAQPVATEAAE